MKKGQISLQFNWIFVFIVGAIILAFFLMIIRSQTKSADYEIAGDIMKNLDTVIKTSQQTNNALKTISTPEIKMKFVCESDISFFDIGNGIQQDTPYDIIFTQNELKGKKLISWTQTWELPFKIATFQYLTTKKVLFVVVNDSDPSNTKDVELYRLLPKNISKIFANRNQALKDMNYDYYKIIEFKKSEIPRDLLKFLPEDKHNIITIDSNDFNTFGTINFTKSNIILPFIKKEMLMGAIFSENAEFYSCTINKIVNRLKTLMILAYNRTTVLNDNVDETRCTSLYNWNLAEMNNILSNLPIGFKNYETIYESSERLSRGNQNLMRGRNCPLIY